MPFTPHQNVLRKTVIKLLTAGLYMAFSLWVNTPPLRGQTVKDSIIELEEVQVKASRIFRKETAGMKESRIDSLVMKQKLNLSLSELLSENTPVYIKSHGRGALATASFRGTAASHTQVNWNGISINTPMLGMVDFSLIPVYIIDDIALKHGGASVSGQSGGLGGSINISNRPDRDNPRQISYLQGVGSYSTWDQFLLTSLGNNKVQWRSRIYYTQSENDYTFVNRTIADRENGQMIHPVDTNKHGAYSRYGTLQELYWQPGNRQWLSLQWWGQWADRGIPRVISFEGAENTNIGRQNHHDHKAVASWQWYGEQQDVALRSGYAFQQMDYTLTNRVSGTEPVPAVYSKSNQQSFMQQLSYRRQFSAAVSLESQLSFDHHNVHTRDTVTQTGYTTSREDFSLLLALRSRLHQRVHLNLMMRQEYVGEDFSPLIPFLGVDYLVYENNPMVLKANITRNYNHPSLNDLFWVPGGNPGLKPEKGFSTEAGLQNEWSLQDISLQSEITVFRSDINDWIIWLPGFKGYWEPQNIRRVLSRGIEAHALVSGQLAALEYRIMATYAYTRAIQYGEREKWGDESYGKQLPFIPAHSGNALLNLQYKRYAITWQHNSYSERFTTSSNDLSRRNWLYPYFMNDLSLSAKWQWGKVNLQAELKVYNLFNETYHTILYRPMPGRNFMVTLRTTLN